MLRSAIPFCLTHKLKREASRTCRCIECNVYPSSLNDLANEPIYPAIGPSGTRDKTTWLSMMHFMANSFPLCGADKRSPDYVDPALRIQPKGEVKTKVRDIVREGR